MKSAGKLIGEISRASHKFFQKNFKHYSIGHAQLATLIHISKNEGISQLEISKQLNLDKSSITSQLHILEKNGYILKKIDKKDARILRVSITEKTKEILKPIRKVYAEWTASLLEGFSDNEKDEIFLYLEKMRDNATKKIDKIKNL